MGTSDTKGSTSRTVAPGNIPVERCDACILQVVPATKQLLFKHAREGGRFFTSSSYCDAHAEHYAHDGSHSFFIMELTL